MQESFFNSVDAQSRRCKFVKKKSYIPKQQETFSRAIDQNPNKCVAHERRPLWTSVNLYGCPAKVLLDVGSIKEFRGARIGIGVFQINQVVAVRMVKRSSTKGCDQSGTNGRSTLGVDSANCNRA